MRALWQRVGANSAIAMQFGVEAAPAFGVGVDAFDGAALAIAAKQQASPARYSFAFTILPSGYSPASTMHSSPNEMPMPALAPIRLRSPTELTCLPPPDSVPMMDAPAPKSLLRPTITPGVTRPSTMARPTCRR